MFNTQTYITRRNKLREQLDSGIAIILGNPDAPMNYPANIYHYRQDSSFLYFFGVDLPGFAGVFDIDENKDYLFGDDVSIDDIIWMGPQPSVKEMGAKYGLENTLPYAKFADFITEAKNKGRKIHFLPVYRAENKILLHKLLGVGLDNIKEEASVDFIKAVVNIRAIKEKQEIAHLDEIMDVAYEMHTAAMKMAQPGVYEREVAGTIEGIALKYGGMVSFPVILSKRGETLHNHYHGNKLEKGDLMLADAGFESPLHYATDHTRTSPVGGKFTQKQKEIYEIVLAANNRATDLIKPDVTYQSIHLEACKVLAEGLTALGLMKGNTEEAVKLGAHALFMPHGLGHMMGIDVHDMEDLGENYVGYDEEVKRIDQFGTTYLRMGRKLKAGHVMTNEPGIYFIPALIDKWYNEKIHHDFINFDKVNEYRGFGGVRLEDDLLVTENGGRMLGKKRIPITVEEVENMIQS